MGYDLFGRPSSGGPYDTGVAGDADHRERIPHWSRSA